MSKIYKNTNAFKNRQSKFIVDKEITLLPFLMEIIKDKSRNKIKSILAHQQIKVNDKITTQFDLSLKKGSEVAVNWDKAFNTNTFQGFSIVFEDEDIIVINKRSGFLSIASKNEKQKTVYQGLSHYLQKDNPKAHLFVIHRLDREASGLMVFAKNQNAQYQLQNTWESTILKRKYLIVCEGTFEKDEDTIASFLNESKALIVYSGNNSKIGKKAVSHYQVIKKNEFFTLLEAWQETERKNQIRVHLQSIGHPVLGDKKYGSKQNPINRTTLHLKELVFMHPTTHKEVKFETKPPEDFLKIFRQKFYR